MDKIDLGEIQIIDPRELWTDEARHFTPWLADNAQALSDAIGIPIDVETTEQSIGDFKLDIYGTIEGTDKKVAIENQLDPSDHKHLGQVITYAAGLDASVVIWVTPTVRQEHKDAIEWLNDISSDTVSFFLIRPEVIKIDQSKPAIRFVVEAEPSDFIKTIKEVIGTEEAPRHQYRRQFWQQFLDYLAKNGERWASNRKTTKDSWIYTSGGQTGVKVNVSMSHGTRIRVEITLEHKDSKQNDKWYQTLENKKDILEQALLPETVSWESLEGKKSSRVAVYRDYDKDLALKNKEYQDELFAWLMKNLLIMRRLARKILK